MRNAILAALFLLLVSFSSARALTATPSPTPTATPFPVMCTPPPCPPEGYLTCGNANGCPGGCGTICVLPTVEPESEPVTIPEPVTILLLGTGVAGLASYVAARRR